MSGFLSSLASRPPAIALNMPKHAFKFPPHVVNKVKTYVREAIDKVDPNHFNQEPQYVAALLILLKGRVYEGPEGIIIFDSTVYNDRGRSSTESIFGADFAITAEISAHGRKIRKAIIAQAKLGSIVSLSKNARNLLDEQIRKMKQVVRAPKVMEIQHNGRRRRPAMISGNHILDHQQYKPMDLPDYFAARVLTTLDGCTNPTVVDDVQDSQLSQLRVSAEFVVERSDLVNVSE